MPGVTVSFQQSTASGITVALTNPTATWGANAANDFWQDIVQGLRNAQWGNPFRPVHTPEARAKARRLLEDIFTPAEVQALEGVGLRIPSKLVTGREYELHLDRPPRVLHRGEPQGHLCVHLLDDEGSFLPEDDAVAFALMLRADEAAMLADANHRWPNLY